MSFSLFLISLKYFDAKFVIAIFNLIDHFYKLIKSDSIFFRLINMILNFHDTPIIYYEKSLNSRFFKLNFQKITPFSSEP